jgi:hypothetical protein
MGLLSLPREFGLIIPTPGAYKGHPKWHRRRNIERVSHHHHAATHYHAAAHHHHQAEHHHAVGEHEEAKKHAAAAKEHSELAHKHTTDVQTHSHDVTARGGRSRLWIYCLRRRSARHRPALRLVRPSKSARRVSGLRLPRIRCCGESCRRCAGSSASSIDRRRSCLRLSAARRSRFAHFGRWSRGSVKPRGSNTWCIGISCGMPAATCW